MSLIQPSFKLKSLLLTLALVATSFAHASEYRAGEVIVKYKSGVIRTRSIMNPMYLSLGVNTVQRFGGVMAGFEKLMLKENVKVEDAIFELQKNDLVEYAQPNYIIRAFPTTKVPTDTPCIIPGMYPPGCSGGGDGGGGGGGLPGLPGGGAGGGGLAEICAALGLPAQICQALGGGAGGVTPPPGGGGDTPPPSDGGGTTPPPAGRPDLKPMPAEVNPPIADPDNNKAYGLSIIGALEAHKTWKGSKSMIVAVIDTGIDYNHDDLAFNVWRNPNPTNGDVAGFDFVHNDGLPYDDNEHGTHCAGTIGAVGGNGIGVTGVNERVSIMGLKFLSAEGSGDTAGAIKAIDYAITHGAKVLSNSWGGTGDDQNQALKEAIDRAKAKDVLFIAAAGNDGKDNDDPSQASYPAGFDNDNLISVAATDSNDGVAFFSNYGKKTTHLAAPGVNIYSLKPGNQYQSLSGTSMAAPHAAGAAALVWSKNPTWTYKQVKDALIKTVDPIAALASKTVSGGRVNVLKALQVR